ncbi:MAG: serine--tRNA ligase [Sulfuricurvum sp.]|jgi:seryl-tRNA synthetase|uniref:serine--tRNA ligase n=1 Tax=Sulfuricurvum sp. TaxID=2025608 RepID=UPI0025D77206|nr:serine--tRNA ligase [Sulfuricurvum sp.]MCK9373488.1 serine--tRNA ligase [Sulfuricurvum sp.]
MIDVKLLQKNFDETATALMRKKVSAEIIAELKSANETLKTAKLAYETLQAKQNELSRLFGQYKKEGKSTDELKIEVDANKATLNDLLDTQRIAEEALDAIIMRVPNIPDADVPDGEDENDNIEIKKVLAPPSFTFTPKEHWELAEANGWIDFERGVKLAKSRFSVVSGMGARLERALINFMLDFNRQRGFEEVSVPMLVNRRALEGTGQLPKFEEDLFKVEEEELYLIPTAEVPLTNLYQDEILNGAELPIKMTGYTSCFRKEAGSGGRDVRGMIRQHQFHKVELVSITRADQSNAVFDEMVACASDLLSALGLPHRLVTLCTGDLGFGAARTVDLEVWLPGQNAYREISSVSNTRDFQARRAKIRYKEEGKNILAHTLNGSSLAVGRTMVAIMENFQQEDGSIKIPDPLQKYL